MKQKHPFRFGINITDIKSGDAIRATARKMEDLGYSTLSTSDHVFNELPPSCFPDGGSECDNDIAGGYACIGATIFAIRLS